MEEKKNNKLKEFKEDMVNIGVIGAVIFGVGFSVAYIMLFLTTKLSLIFPIFLERPLESNALMLLLFLTFILIWGFVTITASLEILGRYYKLIKNAKAGGN